MRGINLVPSNINLQFVSRRKLFFIFSALIILASIGLYGAKGLNYGIDFKGGILMEIKTLSGPADIGSLRGTLSTLGLGDISLQEFGAPDEVLITVQVQEGDEKAQAAAVEKIKGVLSNVEYRRTDFVGPKISDELFLDGIYAVGAAMFAIMLYVWFRFEWQFGVGAVAALVHDVISTVGIFAFLGMEFNLTTVAAVLTIAGYSINDTVVVFDRVRENLRRYKSLPLLELLNKSINETLSRTIMTSVTTLLALVSLYMLGGEVLRGFSFAMIWGVLIGTYSSICLAVPLLLYLNIQRRSGVESNKEEATA